MQKPKLVIIGSGFAGLNVVKSLKNAPFDILVIDKANHHLFQPLLYQVATAVLSPGNIATPIRSILAKQANTKVILADIVAIDKENKKLIAENGECFDFDYLVLAPGANHSYFGHPEWELFAPGLKTLDDAIKIRNRVLLSYERAERSSDEAEVAKFMRFVVVGGGPTGVEMCGAIAEIAHHALVNNFRKIKPERSQIYLIEGYKRILPGFSEKLSQKALTDLEKLGVTVMLNTVVSDINKDGVFVGEHFIETANIIWAAGNEASPLLKTLNVPLDKSNRVIVLNDLTIPNYANIFVIGDAACCYDKNGKALPAIAPVAIQQGRYLAKALKKIVKGQKPAVFSYFDKGMMATIGKNKAIAQVGKLNLSGHLAWFAWTFIHILYLITFSNRVLVMMQWVLLYFSNQRRIRLITYPVKEERM